MPDADVDAVTVTVYSREECHLCEEALETVRRVAADAPRPVDVETVDVDDDPALREEYGERVPYVLLDGRPAFKFRVDADELRDRLDPPTPLCDRRRHSGERGGDDAQ